MGRKKYMALRIINVKYKNQVYCSAGCNIVDYLLNIGDDKIKTFATDLVPAYLGDLYKFEKEDEVIKLYKGYMTFDFDEDAGTASFEEVFPSYEVIEYDLSTGKLEEGFKFKDVYSQENTDWLSLSHIIAFMLEIPKKRNPNVMKEVQDLTYMTMNNGRSRERQVVLGNLFELLASNLEGFEKLINSGNRKFIAENIGKAEFSIGNEGKLHKVIGLPKFAIAYIKESKYEDCFEVFKAINTDTDGNSLKILLKFYDDMKIFIKASRGNSTANLRVFSNQFIGL